MKACVFTLGCKLNEAESESIMGGLMSLGYEVTEELTEADLYVLNTCAVTAEAEKKSRQAVARMKKYNAEAPILVCGCASEYHPEQYRMRGVAFVTGATKKDAVLNYLGYPSGEEASFCELPFPVRTKTRAYLRVQDGCDRFCSYCIIPYLRGRSRSRRIESILQEAKACKAKEIVLTGVDLSSYKCGELGLDGLLMELKDIPARIRLGSLEVSAVTDGLLRSMKEGDVCPHFHLSLQSGSNDVLKKMNRKYTREEYLAACDKIYRAFPSAAITTDIIVGFPTETEQDFLSSLSIVSEAGFARVHAFPYSPRVGTPAAKFKGVDGAVKKERMERMLATAKEQEEKYLSRFIGKEETALFESDGAYTGNYIRVYAEGAHEGGMYRVRLQERFQDGLKAELLEELK